MRWFYRHMVRPVLFYQDPERIHQRTLRGLGWVGRRGFACNALASFLVPSPQPVRLWGLEFPNAVGLAAGMDKDAEALPAWSAMGFGFTEIGAVTRYAQPGNPTPRVFRAVAEEAIVNRMGFNNGGAEALAQALGAWRSQGRWPAHPVGVNLGKSKITPLDQAAGDYEESFRLLLPHLDFFVVNVSSPNTPNLRQLQDKAALNEILMALQAASRKWVDGGGRRKPVLVKVAPDLSFDALDEILELVGPRELQGIVATNTTISRPMVADAKVREVYAQTGGLSGKPLRARSTDVIRHIYRQTRGALPIIGSGGIFNAADAWEKILAGASLVQVYTGLVYEGPSVVKSIVEGMAARLEAAGFASLQQAVGTGNS